ncbi:MAG: hypothetical protein JWQ81_4427 [Amycolatopsis sp.]|uniref:TIGR03086 family metal-binding protein n=1 Tax=Amycolatopsis sp. TaxID=37632 RepID=UPI002637218A|nr:TIGR03086 family metal-binding protein [Amycolatopsis sp.]MCU1683688.1 hypothetical protein [Amycolatopsis sp.]
MSKSPEIDLKPACRRMIDVLAGVADGQLTDPTPCAEYTVRELIDHINLVSQGFAAVARKEDPAPAKEWDNLAQHVQALGEAWDDPAAWQGMTDAGGSELPNRLWGRIAFTEMVVHGWDLAKATGQPFDLPDETVRACLDHVTEFVPNAPVPELWGPVVEVTAAASLLDRVVAITGRTP